MHPQRRETFTSQQDITSQKIRSLELRLIFFLSDAGVRRTARSPIFGIGILFVYRW